MDHDSYLLLWETELAAERTAKSRFISPLIILF
uniref:Transposase n=1 Tax=Heterorhabditis bacteriophora TaxID=37862 RepID=A0A1I7W623_HETBA